MYFLSYIKHITICLAVLLCPLAENLQAITIVEAWDDGSLEGWQRSNGNVALYNIDQSLCIYFAHQSGPVFPSESAIFADAGANAGLIGDYIEQGANLLKLRFKAAQKAPGTLWLTIKCANGRTWHTMLEEPPVGEWVEYNAPINTASGWTYGPSAKGSEFLSDIQNVTEVGLFLQRSSSPEGEVYYIDDFTLEATGGAIDVALTGNITYTGEQENGSIYIRALPVGGAATNLLQTTLSSPGNFSLSPASSASIYDLTAYLDVNNNALQENWEPSVNLPSLAVGYEDVSGIQLTLTDPGDSFGLPYWWLNEHFSVPTPAGGGGAPLAYQDSDNDGLNNYGEYRALTDPNDPESVFKISISYDQISGAPVVSWNSSDTRQYTLLRSESVNGLYVPVASGVTGSSPSNSLLDVSVSNGPFYYRVQVDP